MLVKNSSQQRTTTYLVQINRLWSESRLTGRENSIVLVRPVVPRAYRVIRMCPALVSGRRDRIRRPARQARRSHGNLMPHKCAPTACKDQGHCQDIKDRALKIQVTSRTTELRLRATPSIAAARRTPKGPAERQVTDRGKVMPKVPSRTRAIVTHECRSCRPMRRLHSPLRICIVSALMESSHNRRAQQRSSSCSPR